MLQQGFISLEKNPFASSSLNAIVGKKIAVEDVVNAIVNTLKEKLSFSFKEISITKEELNLTNQLVETKYKSPAWTEKF